MNKLYFEMNDKEKQLRHIGDCIDYAICIFAEGLCGTGEYRIPSREVVDLEHKISGQLIEVHTLITKLLQAVEEKEDEDIDECEYGDGEDEEEDGGVIMRLATDEDMKALMNWSVYYYIDNTDEEGRKGTDIVLYNEITDGPVKGLRKLRNLLISGDGNRYISDEY